MAFSPRLLSTQVAVALISAALCLGGIPAIASAQTGPTISGYTAADHDSRLNITGQNFGSDPASVTIDGSPASVVSWSATRVTVNLPTTAGPGTLTLTTVQGLSTSVAFSGVERGYYTLTPQGAVTAHGPVATYGDLTSLGAAATSPAVQMVMTANGQGYWILAQNGSIYNFGDATPLGGVSTPITAVGMAVLPSGTGAYVLSRTGTVYAIGTATNYGSPPAPIPAAAIAVTQTGEGYWVLSQTGAVYAFGDAKDFGSVPHMTPLSTPAPALANGTLVRLKGTSPVFLVENHVLYHIPTLQVLSGMGKSAASVITVDSLNGYRLGLPCIVPYPDGTLLQDTATQTEYVVQNGVLHPVANAPAATAVPAVRIAAILPNWPVGPSVSLPSPYFPTGTLLRVKGHAIVYLVDQNTLRPLATKAVFDGSGFAWASVVTVPRLPPLPIGATIASPLPPFQTGALYRRQGAPAVYVDMGGVLRHIPSVALFTALGFSWQNIHTVSSLGTLPMGAPLGSTAIPAAQDASPAAEAVGLVPTANDGGYWILLQNGKVDAFGNAPFFGDPTAAEMGQAKAVALAVTPDGGGYSILTSAGQVYSFGDALSAPSASGAIDLAMSPTPDDPAVSTTSAASASSFYVLAYGSFMPHYDGSYSTMVDEAPALSAILPTWYYEQQNPTTLAWTIGSPPAGSNAVVAQAHQEGLQVWPMIGSISVGPFQTASAIQATVQQIVAAVQQNDYDGVTIDFEPTEFNGLSLAQVSQQYTNFVAALGPALHAIGKKLMVDVYATFYPNSPYNLAAIAPYVNYINIMTYGEYDSYTEAGPNAALSWLTSVYQTAISDGANPSQIIMGLGPYGDYWSFNNSGLDQGAPLGDDAYVSDAQVATLLNQNPNIVPVWDPTTGSEVFMTNEYVNSNGDWTANPNGEAVAPTETLSIADEGTFLPQVQNLQGLLNYILLRYAVDHHQPVPSYLPLAQDGHYGPLTTEAVAQFQQDFQVANATPGVYGPSTEAALSQVIQTWNLGEYQYWINSTESLQASLTQVAIPDKLGGIAIWRLPFESSDFWTMLEQTVTINPDGHEEATP
ncbi:MAG: glycosyl hydrolase family 18 protein [Firmicutes bacterium]|nr:glycosyl hydrolase family 18 protein [Bacillota bacterium]